MSPATAFQLLRAMDVCWLSSCNRRANECCRPPNFCGDIGCNSASDLAISEATEFARIHRNRFGPRIFADSDTRSRSEPQPFVRRRRLPRM